MLLNRRSLILSLAGAAISAQPVRNPVVVELFTSEGCSSCPPADRVLTNLLAGDFPVIILSEHVDYWNDLGWKDPFSQKVFSERQQWYAESFRNNGPYTPQMIVDGIVEFVGSDAAKARAAIQSAASKQKAALQLKVSGSIEVQIEPLGSPRATADVFLALTENGLTTQVKHGENGGRTLRHDGVVRIWKPLGTWKTDQPFSARHTPESKGLNVVVVAQDRASRRILAAGSAKQA